MPEIEEIQEVQLIIGDDYELRIMPGGRIVDLDWEVLPWGGQVRLSRIEQNQYALGGGVDSWTLILHNSPGDTHHQAMGEFNPGQIYTVSPQGIKKLQE